MPQFFTQPPVNPAGNIWGGVKSFAARGGFINGLNPSLINNIWYVNANATADRALGRGPVGSDGNNGTSPFSPFATMERAFEFVQDYDVIVVDGVIREQLVAPTKFNVTILGGSNLTPRQATSGGVATGGGASWLPPASPTALTPLLEVVRAGWSFINIQFNPTTSSAAVRLTRSAVTDIIDASHARFENCYFLGGGTGQIGIEDNGGCGFVNVLGCRFQLLTGTALLSLNTAAAVPLSWNVQNNRFQQNTNDIKMSLNYAMIMWNNFMTAGSGATNKVIQDNFISSQGNNNHVCHNVFTNTAAEIANASGYNGGAADVWADNYCTNQVDYGIPS